MLKIKTFKELTTKELYEILKLRAEVFIVEQKGCYQDLDDIDYRSTHIFCENEDGTISGCIRVFPKDDEPGTAQLGRLVTKARKTGLGTQLMECATRIAKERYHATALYLTGRESAYEFYQKCGFYAPVPKITTEHGSYYILRRSI